MLVLGKVMIIPLMSSKLVPWPIVLLSQKFGGNHSMQKQRINMDESSVSWGKLQPTIAHKYDTSQSQATVFSFAYHAHAFFHSYI